MSIKRVIFIRPGETAWNRIGRWQGQIAIPLNEHGRLQAERLATFIRPIGIAAIYSSDLRRAKDTAELITEKLDIEPVYDVRWRERHMGEWQGLTLPEIKDWYPQAYQGLLNDPEHYQIKGGESREQVVARVRAAFKEIVAKHDTSGGPDVSIGIISHTTAIRTMLADLVPGSDPYALQFSNISVTTLVHHNETAHWDILQLNDISFLEGMETLSVGEVEKTS